jgi:hypothetical protein
VPNAVELLARLGYGAAPGVVHSGTSSQDPALWAAWKTVRDVVDAAYCPDGSPVLCVRVTEGRLSDDASVATLRHALWNRGVPGGLLMQDGDRIRLYDCTKPPSKPHVRDAPLMEGRWASLATDFSSLRYRAVQSRGLPGIGVAVGEHFVGDRLLRDLRTLTERLTQLGLDVSSAHHLIGRSLLVRFLEGRLPGLVTDRQPYLELLLTGPETVYKFFDRARRQLNGNLFSVSPLERKTVTQQHLTEVQAFLSGEAVHGQRSFWPYDFSVVPPALIGSIYEEFLRSTRRSLGAYYTPPELVRAVLDCVLPWQGPEDLTVFDPACGSGAFLVEAFRRLVQRERDKVGREQLTGDELSQLLTKRIYGTDIDPTAVSVAAFSLYLALVDELGVPAEGDTLRFPSLSANLVPTDYFSDHAFTSTEFDVIVGNPPWVSSLTPEAAHYLRSIGLKVADNQIAMAFLQRSLSNVSTEGHVCLVGPSKAMLHNASGPAVAFRRSFASQTIVTDVVELCTARKGLFRTSSAPAAVMAYKRRNGGGHPGSFNHAVPRRSLAGRSFQTLTIADRDVRTVPYSALLESDPTLNVLVWGTAADVDLIGRLSVEHPTVRELGRARGWTHGEGVVVGTAQNATYDVPEYATLPLLAPSDLAPGTLRIRDVAPIGVHRFQWARLDQRDMFYQPALVVRCAAALGRRIVASFVAQERIFTHALYGIAGRTDERALMLLGAYLNSSLASYFLFHTSTVWGIEREDVNSGELLNFPVAIRTASQTLVDELIGLMSVDNRNGDRGWLDAVDRAVFEAYGLSELEHALVSDTLAAVQDEALSGLTGRSFDLPSDTSLQDYADVLQSVLSANVEAAPTHRSIVELDGFIVLTLDAGHSEEDARRRADRYVERCLARGRATLGFPRDPGCVMLDNGSVVVVQPAQRRHWTATRAQNDALRIIQQLTD